LFDLCLIISEIDNKPEIIIIFYDNKWDNLQQLFAAFGSVYIAYHISKNLLFMMHQVQSALLLRVMPCNANSNGSTSDRWRELKQYLIF